MKSYPSHSAQSGCAFFSHHVSLHRFLLRVLTVPLFLILPSAFGAGGPPPTTVEGHVSVEGVVEVLNDVLRQPYNESRQISSSSATGQLNFDVPAAKRLVIETISIQAIVTGGSQMRVDGQAASGGTNFNIDVPLQSQGVFDTLGNQFSRAMQSVKIRVDGTAANGEIFFGYTRIGAGISTLRVNLHGYLVDLTQ
jgi:hypothetical protein